MLKISNGPLAPDGLNLPKGGGGGGQAESLKRLPPGQSEIPENNFVFLKVACSLQIFKLISNKMLPASSLKQLNSLKL